MLRISWTAHKTNKEVLDIIGTKTSLIQTIKQRKLAYFGHISRRDGLQRSLLEGKINGKRGRGRPKMNWIDNIKEWTGLTYYECVRISGD